MKNFVNKNVFFKKDFFFMIKEIEKPDIKFNFYNSVYDKYYYDDKNNEFFIIYFKSKYYFNLDGNYHRIGKPAIEFFNGGKIWEENGKMHRIDGPASYDHDNHKFWINGKNYSKLVFAEKTNHLLCKNCNKFCKQKCF